MGACFGTPDKAPLLAPEVKEESDALLLGGENLGEDLPYEDGRTKFKRWQHEVTKSACCPGAALVVWRFLLLAACIALLVYSLWEWTNGVNDDELEKDQSTKTSEPIGYWFIYLTHWGLTTETLYFLVAFLITLVVQSSDPKEWQESNTVQATPWYVSLSWALQAIMLPMSVAITILFWVLVYDPSTTPTTVEILTHGGNAALMLLDFIFVQQPLFCRKIVWPVVFSAAYLGFSFAYYKGGGTQGDGSTTYIYKDLDWADPKHAGMIGAIMAFGAMPVLYVGTYLAYRIRSLCFPSVNEC